MTDKQWQLVIKKCQKAGLIHQHFLKIAEEEYERRYGYNPSEVDDDFWIDSLHQCKGNFNLKEIKDSAKNHTRKN